MEIHPSARKHGVAAGDIEHATEHAMAIDQQEDDTRLYLGPSRSAELLEVVTIVPRRRLGIGDPRDEDASEVQAAVAGRMRMAKKTYGKTASGKAIGEQLVTDLAAKAEAGYDVDETLRRRGGRPPMGAAAASVESVRLDPDLREALAERARRDKETTSSVIRRALREYLGVA